MLQFPNQAMRPLCAALVAACAATPAGQALAQGSDAAPASPLEEVIVTSSLVETPRRQIGTAVSVVGADEIELRGYNSVADLLRTQPGVGVSNSGGPGKTTTLRIRGEEGYRTLLIIDGVKAIDPTGTQAGPAFSGLLSTSDMERVEILRGPQGFVYGADAGGVVNVMTKTGMGAAEGRVGLESGEYGTRQLDASVAGGSDAADYYLSVSDFETDGFNAQTADTLLQDADGADNTTLHAKLGWTPTDDMRLQIVVRDIDASTLYDGCFDPMTFATVHDCTATSEQTTARLSADWSTGMLSHRFSYSGVDITNDNFSGPESTFRTEGSLGRFEYTGTFAPSNGTTLVYGVDLQNEEVTTDVSADRNQDGYYFEYQGAFGDRFYLSAGARHDDNDDFGSHVSTRISGAWLQALAGGDTLKYRASFGTGFRAPSLFEVAYNRGPFAFPPAANVSLAEETSEGFDVGVEYIAAGGLRLELTYFDQKIEDEIFFDLNGFSGYLQSSGTSSSTGIELAAAAPLGERLELLANLTRNDAEDTTNTQRLRRPELLANVGLLYLPANDRLRVAANYRVSRDAIDIGNVRLDDYEVLDLSLAWRLNDTVEIHGRVENAMDESYQEIIGFNTAARSAYVGVRLSF